MVGSRIYYGHVVRSLMCGDQNPRPAYSHVGRSQWHTTELQLGGNRWWQPFTVFIIIIIRLQ
jgi:hypothetical protein